MENVCVSLVVYLCACRCLTFFVGVKQFTVVCPAWYDICV